MGRRAVLTLAGLAAGGLLLSGCRGDLVKAAPHAADAGCRTLTAKLPAQVLDRSRRGLDVQGAAEWGDPAIVLRCGVSVPGPTASGGIAVNDVCWIFTQTKKYYVFTSFGRTPATEVDVPFSVDRTSAPSALVDLDDAVDSTPRTSLKCR